MRRARVLAAVTLVQGLCGCAESSRSAAAPDATLVPAAATTAGPRSLPHAAPTFGEAAPQSIATTSGLTFAEVAARVAPSVVSVASTRSPKAQAPELPLDDPWLRRFFGPGLPFGPEEPSEPVRGLGSGVIVAPNVVLTNAHVVEDGEEITVTVGDKRELAAKVVGADPKSDLAVLKLEGDVSALRPLAFGDSSRLRPGDVVLAVGNPFGVGQTVTMGIVSATGRANLGIVDYEDFIQTDAAVNPGNSGGALVDMQGNLVGIPTAILSRGGGYAGIGFAIPSNMAKPILQSLLEHGKVVRGWLGVTMQDIDRDLSQALSLPSTEGVLISGVAPGGPAEKAGLQSGDVVLRVNGTHVESTGQLRNAVAAAGTGRVNLEILRQGRKRTVQVALVEMPAEPAEPRGARPPKAQPGIAGMALAPLTPSPQQRLNVADSVKAGVVITDVAPNSAASRAGLRPGDVVIEVDRKRVSSADDVWRAWNAAKGATSFLVHREGNTFYVVVRKD